MAENTLRDFSVPSAANVATRLNVDVGDVNFELKSSLINMVQASPFCGSRTRTQMLICRIFWSSATPLSYGVLPPMLSSFVCFPFPSWGRQNSGFIKKRASTPGPNAPRHSSQNSSHWAKQIRLQTNYPSDHLSVSR